MVKVTWQQTNLKSKILLLYLFEFVTFHRQEVALHERTHGNLPRQAAWYVPLGSDIKLLSLISVSHHILTNTVVTQAAVGGPRRAEHFTSEAVFELYHLLVDEDLLGSRRGAIRRGS